MKKTDKRKRKVKKKMTMYKYAIYHKTEITKDELTYFKKLNLKKEHFKIFSFIHKINIDDNELNSFKIRISKIFQSELRCKFSNYQLMKLFNCSEKSISNWNLFTKNYLKNLEVN